MAYAGKGDVTTAERLLKDAGFTVSETCCSRPSCFDFAARKGQSLIFVKVISDLDRLSVGDLVELKNVARSVSGNSLLISQECRDRSLEDDTVYRRQDVSAVTLKTFENITKRGIYPLIQAGPGGYYVEIDGEAIRKRRQELGLSVGKMAEMISISRRTLYGYEQGMAKASVGAAYNMIYTLGIPVAKPVNIFEKPKAKRRKCKLLSTAKNALEKNRFLTRIFRRLDRYHVTTTRKAPFDFIITVSEEKMRIIGGVATDKEQALDRRIEEITSVSRVVHAHPLLIADEPNSMNKEISVIQKKNLTKIKTPEELLSNIT